ncbi:hypothetical protein Taro_004149 [Colocasia esculenta]|uniref:Thioredoxin domain-containing protein n=1 Tax=Colocasia esculenta TaxID=4460 RepID=A0A843TP80_COLES|nr:hypothetical protein [Colocasia esculenta]
MPQFLDLKGKVVLLDFWTYCCINCMHVLPDLEFLEKKYREKPFTVIGVHSAKFDNEKDLEAIRNAVLRYNIAHPVVNDGDMRLWRELGINSWPTFVLVSPTGKLLAQISGEGHRKGLAYNPKKNLLYVADTENHALREINFCGLLLVLEQKAQTIREVLNSPWDVCFEPVNEIVYIAMAGQHQIWEHNTLTEITRVFSGDGYERNLNGSSSTTTSFAQPSGISLSPDLLEVYVADSESSSIRALDLKSGGSKLLAGGDPLYAENLFKFGDKDGVSSDALFQHPLGIFCGKGRQIYIADSYNHKIKKLDPISKRVVTLAGNGKAGFKDGAALSSQLSEPSGIVDAGNGRLFIADTNNNAIRYLDLDETDVVLHTLELKGVTPPSPRPKSLKRLRRRLSSDTQIIKVNGGSSAEGNLSLRISVPEGYHFSKEARSRFNVDTEPENVVTIEPADGFIDSEGHASLHFTRTATSPALGRINCKVYYCKEDEVCLYESLAFDVSFQEAAAEPQPADLTLRFAVRPKASASDPVPAFTS